jgi:gliding motility-associated-like protein
VVVNKLSAIFSKGNYNRKIILLKLMKPTIRYIFLFVCVIAGTLATTIACAQVTAKFSTTPQSGCEPLFVSFSNSSSGTGTLTYNWNFGNGNTSTLTNPSQTYNSCGNYVVTLTVSNGSQTSKDTAHITVYCKPTAGFKYNNSSGCPGTCINFTNTATPGSGTISSMFWDFGDGNTDTSANPTHCYMSAGTYNVSLTVTNSFGCSIINVITNAINIYKPPVANFSGTPTAQCNPPASVSFSNFSTGTGKLTYNWNFGDPTSGSLNTSTATSPNHNYISTGNYTVTLVVTDGNGCTDTLTLIKYINIGNLPLSVTTTPSNSGCCPLVVDFGEQSGGTPTGYLWTFGGGISNSTAKNPQIIFPCPAGSNPVVYNVTLTETITGGCTATATTNITVTNKPVANFSSSSTLSTCVVPNIVTFKNTSTAGAGAKYIWFFGDGDTSSAVNPSHAYIACGPYNVKLVVFNQYGCSDTVTKTAFVNIICLIDTFTATPIDGCIPKTVSFNSTGSTGNPIKWRWNFGDPSSGAADSSLLQNPTHIYSNPGCYTVTLYTTNASGCSDSVRVKDAVCVDKPPNPNFSATPTTTCAYNNVVFTNLSTGTDSLTTYLWRFGDGNTSSSANPSHIYNDTGYFNVTLIVCNAGCCDSITFNNYIHIFPPIAIISVIIDCKTPYNVCFDGTKSLGASTYSWNFGDPGSGVNNTSTSPTPCHSYSSSGDYTVSLTVYNSVTGCSFTQQTIVHVRKVKAAFTFSPTSGCIPLTVNTVNNSIDANSYAWVLIDSATGTVITTATGANQSWTFLKIRTVFFELIATDINGCSDTLISPVRLRTYGVVTNFTATPTTGCSSLHVQFTDLSTSTGGPITSWIWNFGDPYSSAANDTSILKNPTHTYTKPGCYTVTLTTTNLSGCSQTTTSTNFVCVTTPATGFMASDTNTCVGNQICFTSTGTGFTYIWNFGDPASGAKNISGLANPCHTYNAPGQYTVSLKIVAITGCDSSLTKTNYITITKPVANFGTSGKTVSTCPPLLVNFVDSSYSNIASWKWNFGDGNSSTIQNPSHIYNAPGTYTVTLIVTNTSGCTDTLVKVNYVVVSGPNGTFTFTPNEGCAPLDVCFKAIASLGYTYIWNYGNTTSGPLPGVDSICYYYTVPGIYHPSLILQDSLGCTYAINSPDSVFVDTAEANFGIIDNPKCSPGVVNFIDSSYSLSGIALWKWNFGDPGSGIADSSQQENPSHNYTKIGKYPVTLIIKTVDGCTSIVIDTLNVVPGPVALMDVLNNPVCPGGIISFRDSSTSVSPLVSWSWNFGDPGSGALNTSTSKNTSHKYNKPGKYKVELTIIDQLGCSDTNTNIITVLPLPNVIMAPNSKICDGQSATLNATGGIIYLWSPTNSLSNDSIYNPVASPTTTTTYVVSVTDTNGCQNKDSLIITVNSLPVVTITPDEKICFSSPKTLNAGGGVSYNWSPSAGLSNSTINNPVANPTSTTTYMVIVTGSDGCKNEDSLTITVNPLPLVIAGPNQNICVGSTAALKGSGGILYDWTSNPPGFNSKSNNIIVQPTTTTEYILTATDTNGCSANDTSTVFVHQLPVVSINNNVFLCIGSSTQLVATGGSTYQWSPLTGLSNTSIPNPTANPVDTTEYYVTVTDTFGCQAKDSVMVDVLFPFKANVNPGDTICAGSSVQLNASGGSVYNWYPAGGLDNPSVNDPVASPTVTTVYNVAVSDGHCFSDTGSVLVYVYPDPAFDAGKDQTISAGQSVILGQLTPSFTGTFLWIPSTWLSCNNCQNPTAKPDSTTTYVVTLINQFGCRTSDSVTLTILCPEDVVFIPNAFTPNGDGLDDVFYVRSMGLLQVNYFRVFDRWGQLLFETNDLNIGWDGTFKGQKLPPAVYVYDFNGVCSTGATIDKKGNVTLIR